jgi:hypothetical protein
MAAESPEPPGETSATMPSGVLIEEGAEGIRVEARGVPLGRVLDELGSRSGIGFDLRPDLARQPVTLEVEAATWGEAVARVLAGYNTVMQAGEGADRPLERVWVLGRTDRGEIPPPAPAAGERAQPPQAPARAERTPWNPGPEEGMDPGTADAPPGVVSTLGPDDGPPIGSDSADRPPPASGPYRPGPPGQ